MTDQHRPDERAADERPADDAAPPPERAEGDRSPDAAAAAADEAAEETAAGSVEGTAAGGSGRPGRPPIAEGPTVPLKRTPPTPSTSLPQTAAPSTAAPSTATPSTSAPSTAAHGGEESAPITPPASRPPLGDEPLGIDDAVPPDQVTTDALPADAMTAEGDEQAAPPGGAPRVPGKDWPFKKFVSAGVLIWVLLALFGFTLVVQLRSNNSDEGLASARQDDLVRILSDLEARDTRLQAEIAALETSQRQLTSGVAGRQAALAEAEKRADELGLLAGTLPGRGRGLDITIDGVRASAVLNTVQELRGAGGEVMQLSGANGDAVRIVASTYFVDAEGGGIVADGKRLTGPYRLLVIGVPQTMQTALEIPGGVVASVKSGGGSVTMEQRDSVDVTALREATSLQYARPVS